VAILKSLSGGTSGLGMRKLPSSAHSRKRIYRRRWVSASSTSTTFQGSLPAAGCPDDKPHDLGSSAAVHVQDEDIGLQNVILPRHGCHPTLAPLMPAFRMSGKQCASRNLQA
jgi:hypothetical protein